VRRSGEPGPEPRRVMVAPLGRAEGSLEGEMLDCFFKFDGVSCCDVSAVL
jgi:hypothetical protein